MTTFTKIQRKNRKIIRKIVKEPIKSSKFEDSFNKFNLFYSKFLSAEDGVHPVNRQEWFEQTEESHLFLRKKIGGITVTKDFKIAEQNAPVDRGGALKLIDYMKIYLPDLNKDTGLKDKEFINPMIGKIRTGKFIGNYSVDYLKKAYPNDYQTRDSYYRIISGYLSQLGSLLSKSKIKEFQRQITIDTSAQGFVQLGHYGPDRSCFSQQGCNGDHKYRLANSDNTFVIIIRELDTDKVLSRMWGFYNSSEEVFNTCNFYPDKNRKNPTGEDKILCRALFADLLNTDQDKVNIHERKISVSGIYHNIGTNDWSFSTKSEINSQKLFGSNISEDRFRGLEE